MPRKNRKISATGVYHVMLRGINKGAIFTDETDCNKFVKILQGLVAPVDRHGIPLPPYCHIHAYCLMNNHVHLLISEAESSIASVMKRIGVAYVSYFNKRHERLGPLFHDRYRSEPVEDAGYFITLLRYIHQNPVKANLVGSPNDFRWSSWHEYNSTNPPVICSDTLPFAQMTWKEVCKLVKKNNQIETEQVNLARRRLSDIEAQKLIAQVCGNRVLAELPNKEKKQMILQLVEQGIAKTQLSRLTGISYGSITHHTTQKTR